jgi:predicted Zn-dependent protease
MLMLEGSMRSVLMLLFASAVAHAAPAKVSREAAEQQARGDAWTLAGRCDEAIKSYRASLAIDAKNATAKVRLASCLARSSATGAKDEAKEILETLADAPAPANVIALMTLGDLYAQAGDHKKAVEQYESVLARKPNDLDARVALAESLRALAEQGDAQARQRCGEIIAKLKTDKTIDQASMRRVEETENALKYGEAAKDMIDAKRRMLMGDSKGALPALERAAVAKPDLEEAQYLLGMVYATPEVARKEDARKAWRKAPHVKEAHFQLGIDAYEGGDLEEALKRLASAAEIDGRYQAAYYQIGLVHYERGDTEQAKRAWQRAYFIDGRSELGRWASTKMQMVTGDVRSLAEGQIIDPSSEISIGQAIAQKVAERFGKIDDKALEDRLERILKKLTLVSDRPDRELRYKVLLIDVPMVNALTLPGGTILMFRGLIDLVKNKMGDTDDAWASVLGHECAHAALRHGMGMIQVASSLAEGKAFAGGAGDLAGLLNTVSRAHEFEADQFGALYAYRAGFNPALSFLLHEKMLAVTGEIPRGMTHPTHAERMARLRDYLLDLRRKVRGFDLAVKALESGDYDAASSRLEVFLGVFPDSTSARSNLGVALHRKALSALPPSTRFRRATDVDPNSRARKIELRAGEVNTGGLKPAAKIDERLLRDAAVEYQAALSIDPTYTRAMVNLGAALHDLKDKRKAREVLEKAVRAAPQSKEAWNNLATVAAEGGDAGRAKEALDKAIAIDGAYADAWFNMALVEEQAGKPQLAAAAWDKFLQLDGKSGWADVARQARARIK